MYESTVKIKLADLAQGLPNNNLFKDFDVFASSNKIAAEIELMQSSLLLAKTTDILDFNGELYRIGDVMVQELYTDAPIKVSPLSFTHYLDAKISIKVLSYSTFKITAPDEEPINGFFGDTVYLSNGTILICKNEPLIAEKPNIDLIGHYEYTQMSNEKIIEKIEKNLDVIPADKDVPVISIIYKSAIPQKSADFVNQLAKSYIEDYIDSKYTAAETTVRFLDDRIQQVSMDLSTSESRIENYKNNKGIVDLHQESETDLRKIAQLKIQLASIKISLEAMQELEDNLRNNNKDFLLKAPN
ncbi:MAG: hypothetical protein ACJAUF_001116, partial [Bacteroidia bacterium]